MADMNALLNMANNVSRMANYLASFREQLADGNDAMLLQYQDFVETVRDLRQLHIVNKVHPDKSGEVSAQILRHAEKLQKELQAEISKRSH